jgi:hypothetical protein
MGNSHHHWCGTAPLLRSPHLHSARIGRIATYIAIVCRQIRMYSSIVISHSFRIAMEKVPLPSGREGADKADIGIGIPSIILINQKTNGRISPVNSHAFNKRKSGPPQSPPSASGRGGRVLPGVIIVVEF